MTKYLALLVFGLAAVVGIYTLPSAENSRQLVGADGFPRRPAPEVNYVQAPVLVSGAVPGEWLLFVNAGKCCYIPVPQGPGWEGLFIAHWPLAGVPNWQLIGATNDFGATPELHEWELGFGAPIWWNGQWWVVYVSTDDRTLGLPHCERVKLGLARGYTATGPWERNQLWFQLVAAGVWMPALATDASGDLWLHWREVDCTGASVNYSQRLTDLSFGETTPQLEGPKLRWIFAEGSPNISDVAWDGREQRWSALEETTPITGTTITEWYDSGPGLVANTRLWRKTGLVLESDQYALWDASYVRSAIGHITFSKTLTALCGDGRGAETGGWEICLYNTESSTTLAPELLGFGPITISYPTPTPTATPSPTPSPTATPRVGTIRRRLEPQPRATNSTITNPQRQVR